MTVGLDALLGGAGDGGALIVLALLIPLAGALLIRLTGGSPNQRETVTIVTAASLFVTVLAITRLVADGMQPELTVLTLLPGLTVAFRVEPMGALFACIASGLWILTSFYAIGYMRGHGERNQTRFYVCFALSLFSAVGLAFSANLLTLFLFYEALTLATYPLVTHHGDAEAKAGGRTYLGLLLSTSICFLLVAIVATWALTGTLEFSPGGILADHVSPQTGGILLILFAYGVGKAALMPFHRWLPAAMVAPTPVSALLHAVAVVKAGVFTILKIAVYIFGVDYVGTLWSSDLMLFVAGWTVIVASLVAMRQDNLKRRLAYSTVGQLSYIVLGAFIGSQLGALGGGLHLAMHAFGKITLFFCAGAILVGAHKTRVSEMDGLGRTMPLTMIAFTLGAISVIGLPPLGGSWSKFLLVMGAAETGHVIVVAVLLLSSLLNIAYLLVPAIRSFALPAPPAHDDHHEHGDDGGHGDDGHQQPASGAGAPWRFGRFHEAPAFCVIPLCLTALGSVALFFLAGGLYDLLALISFHGN